MRRFAQKWPDLTAGLVMWDAIPSKRRYPDEKKATEATGDGGKGAGASSEEAQESGDGTGANAPLLGGEDEWIESEFQVRFRGFGDFPDLGYFLRRDDREQVPGEV